MIRSGAKNCTERDKCNLNEQITKHYSQLLAISKTASDEEMALYDFLKEPDIYATLYLVYNSLKDYSRRDYILTMLDARQITSIDTNINLLTYALKNQMLNLADDILDNTNNLLVNTALSEVFQNYPDGNKKSKHIAKLINARQLDFKYGTIIEKYLTSSEDSIDTKTVAIKTALVNNIPVSLELVLQHILPRANEKCVITILQAYCSKKLISADCLGIVNFVCSCKDVQTAIAALDCLKDTDNYTLLPKSVIIQLLSQNDLTAYHKLSVLDKLFEFKLKSKSIEPVLADYLCFNQDPVPVRKELIPYLLSRSQTLSPGTVCRYMLECDIDGGEKPAIVKAIFDTSFLDINAFPLLLSKYMTSTKDTIEVKTEIGEILIDKGLKMDDDSFIDYICGTQNTTPSKIRFIHKLVSKGSVLRNDVANAYIERTDPDQFNSELFALIFTEFSRFSLKAMERYLLYFQDSETKKAETFREIEKRCAGDLRIVECQINHIENDITCSLLQAYVLLSTDCQDDYLDIVNWLIAEKKMKISANISLSGKSIKFKNYVLKNRDQLSDTTNFLCQLHKVY